jgi:hypothetical protein
MIGETNISSGKFEVIIPCSVRDGAHDFVIL